jgi:hypothetical protein
MNHAPDVEPGEEIAGQTLLLTVTLKRMLRERAMCL